MPKGDSQDTDIQLVRRAQKGDQGAFGLLVGRYQQRVIYQALRWSKNRADAEDIAQESFVRAWKGLKNFRAESSFYTWLFRIVANTAHSQVRSAAGRATTLDEEAWESADMQSRLTDIDSPEDLAVRDELLRLVRLVLRDMPSDQREALMLREQEDMSYEQIAEIMQTPLGTVRSRIFRARSELSARLRDWRETGRLPQGAGSAAAQHETTDAGNEK